MKRKLLFSVLFVAIAGMGFSQTCTPDPLYADSTFGIWPDTTDNLPTGCAGQLYTTVVDFKAPTDASDVDPSYPPMTPINWIKLDNISGLPSGISYQCNVGSCQWNGGTQGCVTITGVNATAGTYPASIDVTAEVVVAGFPIQAPLSFGGYKLVLYNCSGTAEIIKDGLNILQNKPNPFTAMTTISYTTDNAGRADLNVYNMLGEVVYSSSDAAFAGENNFVVDAQNLPAGIYTYAISQNEKVVSKRMVVNK